MPRPAVRLVLELPVLVLAEERGAHAGQGVGFEQLEPLFKGIVDVNAAVGVEDPDAARAAK